MAKGHAVQVYQFNCDFLLIIAKEDVACGVIAVQVSQLVHLGGNPGDGFQNFPLTGERLSLQVPESIRAFRFPADKVALCHQETIALRDISHRFRRADAVFPQEEGVVVGSRSLRFPEPSIGDAIYPVGLLIRLDDEGLSLSLVFLQFVPTFIYSLPARLKFFRQGIDKRGEPGVSLGHLESSRFI